MNIRRRLHGENLFQVSHVRLLVMFLAGVAGVSAQQKGLAPGKRLQIEKANSSFMSANSVPGIGAAIVLEGQPVWSSGFGMSDLEDFAPATSSTLFRQGSISKPITATAILQLWERGKLDLDMPVQKYCPGPRPTRTKHGRLSLPQGQSL